MRLVVLALVLQLLVAGNLWGQSAEIPARPAIGWVHDATGTLSESSMTRLNDLCDRVAQQSAGQMAVAVVPTTRGEVPRTFATRLFNVWGIGNAQRDDGVLVFVAIDDRKAEIVLGDGIDDDQHESLARDIMSDYMIPQFKRGQPEEVILTATSECARLLLGLELTNREATLSTSLGPAAHGPAAAVEPRGRQQPKWWILGGILAGASGLGGLGLVARKLLRHRTRNCPNCRIPMNKLTESEEDPQLSDSEKVEEKVESVNYDVWSCPTCPHVIKLKYPAWFTSYGTCPRCETRTKSSTRSTIRTATESFQGLEEIYEECQHCSYSHTYTKSTPRLSSSSSSSFSSGGGGFGGGSSSGGGASGSW